jgi:protein-tyrosine phosphatase
MFAVLRTFDQPFNQLPSLHVALAVILAALYARKVAGLARVAVIAGFAVIAASVLTTWQHHFIDVPTGALLGALCVWAWPFDGEGDGRPVASLWRPARDPARLRLAKLYALGAVAVCASAIAVGGAALWAIWIGVSLALVAVAYAALGASAFRKGKDGRLSVAAQWLFAPYLAGAWINSRLWTRGTPAPVAMADGVFVGRVPTARELRASPFAALVDVTAEFDVDAAGCRYALVPMLDLATPAPDELKRAAEAIERLRGAGPLLVCCALGRSRSACAVAAWLIATGRARDADAAVKVVRARQGLAVLGERHVAALAGMAT